MHLSERHPRASQILQRFGKARMTFALQFAVMFSW
jgi:hypothetical protein